MRRGDNCLALKTHKVSHTLECGTKGHQHSSPPSLFSASHNIYSKHMSCPIQELKPWQQGQIQTMLLTISERRDGFNMLVKQETRSEEEESIGGGHFFSPLFRKASIEWHLVSCQILSSTDGHKVNWISH